MQGRRERFIACLWALFGRCEAERLGRSGFAGDGDLERGTDLTHPRVAESAQALDKRPERHALDRVEVDDRRKWDRVVAWLEQYLTRKPADCGRAWPDQCAMQPRNRRVTGKHHDRAAPDLRELAPPNLTSGRKRSHDAPAAARNESSWPHSSLEPGGCVSYAA